MNKKDRLTRYGALMIVLIVLSFLFPACLKAKNMRQELPTRLIATLSTFARENALSDAEMERLLGEIVLNSPSMKKGGVGVIDKETFIILNEGRNAVVIAGQKWEGEQSNKHEILLIGGHRVLASVEAMDVSNLKILVFSPKEVRYINLSNYSGGKYSR